MIGIRAALGRVVERLRTVAGRDQPAPPDDGGGTAYPHFSPESLEAADELTRLGVTSEEYVLDLVEEHGGRMRQTAVCEKSGWSKATVSRTLCDMEDAGQITRVRVGRGKVVCLPDAVPDGTMASETGASEPEHGGTATGD